MLDHVLQIMERECAEEFRSGFIAESPAKLRRILQYFAALHGEDRYPEVRCNAPEFSAVVGATGRVQPCFFIAGPPAARLFEARNEADADLPAALNGMAMSRLRADIRSARRAECATCVCSMWRQPPDFDIAIGKPTTGVSA
jgi:hypothetical protein